MPALVSATSSEAALEAYLRRKGVEPWIIEVILDGFRRRPKRKRGRPSNPSKLRAVETYHAIYRVLHDGPDDGGQGWETELWTRFHTRYLDPEKQIVNPQWNAAPSDAAFEFTAERFSVEPGTIRTWVTQANKRTRIARGK